MQAARGRAPWAFGWVLVACGAVAAALSCGAPDAKPAADAPPAVASSTPAQGAAAPEPLRLLAGQMVASHRKLIVLLDDVDAQPAAARKAALEVGQQVFHDLIDKRAAFDRLAETTLTGGDSKQLVAVEALLEYIESDASLRDADRLAFREALASLRDALARDSTLPAIMLHRRASEDLDAIGEIERLYAKEIGRVLGRFAPRAIAITRQKWNDYVAYLKTIYSAETILRDYGVIVPDKAAQATPSEGEITGRELPPHTVALTFDDGPHPQYTDEVLAILQRYGVPGVFFQVGRNLGDVAADGTPKLAPRAEISRRLAAAGFVLGNHSFSHAKLKALSGTALQDEIAKTDALLRMIDKGRSSLFRFPYGAGNDEGRAIVTELALRSTMWNIDSLDWSDPIAESIAQRVLTQVDAQKRGIILFHDIHERSLKALPMVLDQLIAEGYQFAKWNGTRFEAVSAPQATTPVRADYRQRFAVVIGIDDYAHWPKLRHAVRDASAVRQALIARHGLAADHVFMLTNQQATRTAIAALLTTGLGAAGMQDGDSLFVFFAGHGATKTIASGRELGYIVPVEATVDGVAAEGIAMSELQNASEALAARHALFVMDACYSGLGLARGASFLHENSKRLGRQMLTAGGADQMVSDDGPGGHSIFTWTLLQALDGRGDLNKDGLITATELAAYIAPAVAAVSAQTPAFGSLPGSQGGEYVFELPSEPQFLEPSTLQLSDDEQALLAKIAAQTQTATGGVKSPSVATLQGGQATLAIGPAVPLSTRQKAQRLHDEGLLRFREGRFSEAEAQFGAALALRPDFALAMNNLGYVYYKQGKLPEALRWYEQAIAADPSRAVAYWNLGDVLADLGRVAEARRAFETYLALAPNGGGTKYIRTRLATFARRQP